MLENCTTAQERWGGVSDIIDRWLQDRKQLIILYYRLSEVSDDYDEETFAPAVAHLCELLMDYLSAGHFEVFDQLVKEGQSFNDQEGLKKAKDIFERIDETTGEVLDFNDKYQETDDLISITLDLSKLGETLANRFEAEDEMIAVLHVAHKDHVLSQA